MRYWIISVVLGLVMISTPSFGKKRLRRAFKHNKTRVIKKARPKKPPKKIRQVKKAKLDWQLRVLLRGIKNSKRRFPRMIKRRK